ncbi:MAG TPA: hypothetical protein ENK86_01520, partial [Campylobacterales bacterium]|nr:hypothetical protein [Campylobacterales bacterium]
NNYMPLWFTSKGVKSHALEDFFKTIGNDPMLDTNGAIHKRYSYLKSMFQSNNNRPLSQELMLDIQLTSLYEQYLHFHIYGSIKWWQFQSSLDHLRKRKIAADWVTYKPKYDIANLMFHYPLSKIVQATTPSSFGYPQLLKELRWLKAIQRQGGWVKIPNSRQLRYGQSGKSVAQLIERLRSSGDYTCAPSNGDNTFGPCLQQAIKRFQKRHALYPSGKINSYTLKKLNISVDWKIKKVLLNLDRIKRLPDQDESRYIMVNIPDFKLYYKENGREKLSMRVIVGDKENHTPVFSDKISFIVLNPYWIMPDSIVKNEMIPEILKNPDFLAQRGYEVRTSYNTNVSPIDDKQIDWARVLRTGQTKKYKFMQPPGPKNALGKIKFKFPNQFSVYLHDTPNKKLFNKGQRAFSHGCIRVAEPNRLLAQFTQHERAFSYNRAQRILQGKTKTQLNLSQHVPVHIVYLTAWVNSDGLLHYRNDVYNYDTKQTRAIY